MKKDVGVAIDNNLNFELHIQTQINKANQIAGLMRRSFIYMDYKTFMLLFKALVRPHLEYASSVWSPYKKKDIEAIENKKEPPKYYQKCRTFHMNRDKKNSNCQH